MLPQTPLLDLGAASWQRRGWAGEDEGKREGKRREGEVEERERGRGRGGRGSGGEGKGGPQVTVEPGPLRDLLRHCLSLEPAKSVMHHDSCGAGPK